MRPWLYAVLCLVSIGARADAAPISVVFEGTLSFVSDPLALSWQGNLHAGDAFRFELGFDDSAVGTPNPGTGGVDYTIPAGEVALQVGAFGYTGAFGTVELIDDYQGMPGDFINLSGGVNAGAAGVVTVFAQGAGLLTSESLSEVDWTTLARQPFNLTIYQYGRQMQLFETSTGGPIWSITPEPGSGLLVGAGLAALAVSAARMRH